MEKKGAQIIDYKSKKIMYINFTGLPQDELLETLNTSMEYVKNNLGNTSLVLVDVTDTYFTNDFVNKVKNFLKEIDKHIKKQALVGFMGIKKVILKGISLFMSSSYQVFDDPESAKEWLIEG